MRRHWAQLAAVATALVVGATGGCGLGTPEQAAAPSATVTGAVTGKVSFQTWALKPKFTEYVQGVIDGFEKKYPGVEVEWLDQPAEDYSDKVLSQAAGGNLPDVTNLPPEFGLPLAKQGLLLDVAKADPKITQEYVAGGLDAYRYPGAEGVYGYPWYLNTDVNYWNTELLTENGLDPARLPTTLDELIEQARTFKEKGGSKVFLMSRRPELFDLTNAGIPIMSPDGSRFTFNTPEAAALLDKYRAAYKEGLLPRDVLTDTYAGNSKLFTQESVAWTTAGGNFITSLAGDNPGLAPKVVPSAAIGTPPLYVQGLAVSAKTKNAPAALALARWVTNAENQAAFAHLVNIFPSTTASANDPFFSESDGTNSGDAKVLAFSSLAQAKLLTPVQVSDAMKTIVAQQFASAISGDVTSKEALDEAVAQCDRLLKG